jgi:hypothetical protein
MEAGMTPRIHKIIKLPDSILQSGQARDLFTIFIEPAHPTVGTWVLSMNSSGEKHFKYPDKTFTNAELHRGGNLYHANY